MNLLIANFYSIKSFMSVPLGIATAILLKPGLVIVQTKKKKHTDKFY